MKETSCLFRKLRPLALLLTAAVCPLLFTQCKTTAGSYKDVEYDSSTLKTPSGHGMQKKEYPFDDDGNYRKDWVKTKASGKVRSADKLPDPEPAASAADTSVASTDTTSPGRGYYGPAAGAGAVSAAAAPPTATPQYHKVASGDTLFSLASRYSTSVDEFKRVNGLSGDTIRLGQSLRVP
ncbi:MAG: LysM peptidoglycan-binding domain-containing protein [Verrucomicrobiales bacterium]|nr:LysM peptidoglycan-binding domain-containing protein [Verrucomicrobiales bacterium]